MATNGPGGPISPATAKKRLLGILATGEVSFSRHALEEMQNDGITEDEALAVLRGGVVEPGELEKGSWRYRVRTGGLVVVVVFRQADRVCVVTAWRMKR